MTQKEYPTIQTTKTKFHSLITHSLYTNSSALVATITISERQKELCLKDPVNMDSKIKTVLY